MKRYQATIGVSLFFFLLSIAITFAMEGNKDLQSEVPEEKTEFFTIQNNRLSAKIKKTPLQTVLEELKKKTDLAIEVDGSLIDETVSVEFDSLPLEHGLRTLLRNKSYLLIYTEANFADDSALQRQPENRLRVEGMKIVGKKAMPASSSLEEDRFWEEPFQESLNQSVEVLTAAAVSNFNPHVRMQAMEELGEKTGLAAIPTFKQIVAFDLDSDVRNFAQEMLEQIEEDFSYSD
ncbi:MAG: HEAT repeat domain-containing protein [Nitrospirota bacterium]